MIKKILLLFSVSLFFLGCKKEDLTPSWLKIEPFTLTTDASSQGANSHAITNVWLYMDSKSLGVFELPCVLPILDEGNHTFELIPGVKNNGISAKRIQYPFYKIFTIDGKLTLNDTLTISPTTEYKVGTEFSYIEDFEGAGFSLIKGPSSDTDIVFVTAAEYPEIVKYGSKCGGINLTTLDSTFTTSTQSSLNLPKNEQVFLEIDYRNDNSISMGVIAQYPDLSTSEHTPLVIMNPQTTGEEVWKKIYIDLSEDVSFEVGASSYEIYFISYLDPDKTLGTIYIDNIKVVHF